MIMKTVTLDREKIYEGNLILVNEKNPIRKAADIQLVPADEKRHDILLEAKAAEALKILLNEISAGESIVCVSGYRSLAEQTEGLAERKRRCVYTKVCCPAGQKRAPERSCH